MCVFAVLTAKTENEEVGSSKEAPVVLGSQRTGYLGVQGEEESQSCDG